MTHRVIVSMLTTMARLTKCDSDLHHHINPMLEDGYIFWMTEDEYLDLKEIVGKHPNGRRSNHLYEALLPPVGDEEYWRGSAQDWHSTAIKRAKRIRKLEDAIERLGEV